MALKKNQIVYVVTDYKGIFIARKAVVGIVLGLNVKVECDRRIIRVSEHRCFESKEDALNFAIANNTGILNKMVLRRYSLLLRIMKIEQFINDQLREVEQLNRKSK